MTFNEFMNQHDYSFGGITTFYIYKDHRNLSGEPACIVYKDCGEIRLRMDGFPGFLLSDLMNFEVLDCWREQEDPYFVLRVVVYVNDDGKSSETNSNFGDEKEIMEKMGIIFEKMLLDCMKEVHEKLDKVADGLKDLGNSAKQNMQTAMDMVFEHNAAVFAGEKDPYYERMRGECEKCEQNVNKDGKSSETNSEKENIEAMGLEKMLLDQMFEHYAAVLAGERDTYYDRLYGGKEKCEENANSGGKSSETNCNDLVNHPKHYISGNGIECIDAIEAATEDLNGIEAVCVANILKYVWRFKRKNGIEDLKKARWYLEKLIENEEKEERKG